MPPLCTQALQSGASMDDEAVMEKLAQSIQPSDLESPELRSEATGSAASKVSCGDVVFCYSWMLCTMCFPCEFAPIHKYTGM